MPTQTFIVSDLHLGSTESHHGAFAAFVRGLPEGATLIMNGDVINHSSKHQPRDAVRDDILSLLARESYRRPIVWLGGNNDATYRPPDPGQIDFRDSYAIGKRLYVCHGHRFLALPRCAQRLQGILKGIAHILRVGGDGTLHMAALLKRVPLIYRLICNRVAHAAIRFARRNGYEAITCGHTHHFEARERGGIRYFNTGAWTEETPHYVELTTTDIRLRPFLHTPASSALNRPDRHAL